MLAILLIYIIGHSFYHLAQKNQQTYAWAFAILGVVSYYAGALLLGIGLALVYDIWGYDIWTSEDLYWINFLSIPIGGLCCWLFYQFLKKRFENQAMSFHSDILDDDLDA